VRKRLLIALGVVVFLVVAFGLARYLTTENTERNAIAALLAAQGRGDANAMLAELDGSCRTEARCRSTVAADARRLRRRGTPKIISLQSGTAYALGEATGTTRVAWTAVDEGLPVVQCVVVRRGGSALAGRTVTLLRISAPIGNESSC